jgi:hypothetical protein
MVSTLIVTVSDPPRLPSGFTDSGNNKAEGHKQDKPAGKVVTSAHSTIEPALPSVKSEHPPAAARPHVDFAFLRQQVS